MRSRTAFDTYDWHLRLQAEISFGAELAFFHSFPDWQTVGTAVDFGCGNGAYLYRLARAFPDIEFLGVDYRDDAIAVARRDFSAPNIVYHAGRLSTVDQAFDALLSRFCLLYVDDLGEVARWADANVKTLLLQIDPEDELMRWPPSLRRWRSELHWIKRQEREGRLRTARDITAPIWKQIGFEAAWSHVLVVNGNQPLSRDLFHTLLVLMAEHSRGTPLSPELHEELLQWRLSDDYAQYAMRASWYRRTALA